MVNARNAVDIDVVNLGCSALMAILPAQPAVRRCATFALRVQVSLEK